MRRFATPLLLGVLALAAVVRFPGLGAPPLDPGEASRSVAAWWTVVAPSEELSRLAPRPDSALLLGLDYPLFWVFDGASDLTARLVPAVAGLALVALALLLRSQSSAAALSVALLLAADPWLVAMSRRASGAILAAACAIACHLLLRRLGAAAPAAALEPLARRQWTLWACAFGLLVVTGSSAWDFLPPVAAAAALAARGARMGSSPRAPKESMVAAGVTAALVGSTTGLLQWRGPALLSSSLETWLSSWTGAFGEMSLASIARVGAGVLLYQVALAALAAWGLWGAWNRGAGRSAEGPTRDDALGLLPWLLWGAAMQLRSSTGADAWLALEVPLLLAAALGLELLLAQLERGAASTARRTALGAIAALAIGAALAGTTGMPRPAPALPSARRIAGDLLVLLDRPVADRPRIEVVTGPSIDGVLAWYLRDVPLHWVASASALPDDGPRVVVVSAEWPGESPAGESSAPRYVLGIEGDTRRGVELR